MDTPLLLGIAGMILILVAFLMNQLKKWSQETLVYDCCNAAGSLFLVIYAYSGRAWPFLILNGVWMLYSAKDVVADLRRRKT